MIASDETARPLISRKWVCTLIALTLLYTTPAKASYSLRCTGSSKTLIRLLDPPNSEYVDEDTFDETYTLDVENNAWYRICSDCGAQSGGARSTETKLVLEGMITGCAGQRATFDAEINRIDGHYHGEVSCNSDRARRFMTVKYIGSCKLVPTLPPPTRRF
jgi:hypothetical protein